MAALETGMIVVFGLIVAAVVLFVTEAVTPDTTAIAVIVALAALEPWTRISPNEAISGFSSSATLTIVAMYILSGGIQETGIVRRLGQTVSRHTRGSRRRLLAATIGLTGPIAGVINNTPVVAVFIPMVSDLADQNRVSPSKLMIPLSYASMLGGTLTLIGTATNLIASDLSDQLLDHPFSMFEFTHLGILVLLAGSVYLITVGQRLLPERIHLLDLTEKFEMEPYLWRAYVREDSPLVGATVEDAVNEYELDLDILQIVRGNESFVAPGTDQTIDHRDRLTVRANEETVREFEDRAHLRLLPRAPITEAELDRPEGRGILVEAVVSPGSSLIGESIAGGRLRERYRATVLAIRRGGDFVHEGLPGVVLEEGDGLLLHATEQTISHLNGEGELIIAETSGTRPDPPDGEPGFNANVALALVVMAAVIGVAALDILPIVITALGGVVVMLLTGIIRPGEAYDAVHWDVVFLLAGVFPLGLALQRTGGAAFLAELIVTSASVLPPVVMLAVFYVVTGLLASVITPVASVVLMIPIAVDTAQRIGANGFAFVLAVTFAASTAFITPIGYQTNLMVYSPGGYRFTDFARVGVPLQLLLAVVTTVGIAVFWGVGT